jgi:hypothetical protein
MSTTPYKIRCRICTRIQHKELTGEQIKSLRSVDLICDICDANRTEAVMPEATEIEVAPAPEVRVPEEETPSTEPAPKVMVRPFGKPRIIQ